MYKPAMTTASCNGLCESLNRCARQSSTCGTFNQQTTGCGGRVVVKEHAEAHMLGVHKNTLETTFVH